MSKTDVYEMFFQCMSECLEWAYDNPKSAVSYFGGLWTMTNSIVEKLEAVKVDFVIEPRECTEADIKRFSELAKEVST